MVSGRYFKSMQSYNVRIKLKFNNGYVTGIIWILTLKIHKYSLHLLNKKCDGFKDNMK